MLKSLLLWGLYNTKPFSLRMNWIFVFCFSRSAPAAGAPAEGGAPQQPPNLTSNRRLQQTQAQVDEVSSSLVPLLTGGHLRPYLLIGLYLQKEVGGVRSLSFNTKQDLRTSTFIQHVRTHILSHNSLHDIVSHLSPQVVDIMRVNVDKVLERDQKLSELDDRADALQAGASQFETSAAKLKNKYWWKNAKVRTCRHA